MSGKSGGISPAALARPEVSALTYSPKVTSRVTSKLAMHMNLVNTVSKAKSRRVGDGVCTYYRRKVHFVPGNLCRAGASLKASSHVSHPEVKLKPEQVTL
jgi:hypothetical protein